MIERRRFLQVGGLTVAAAAVAACTGDDENEGQTSETTAVGADAPSGADIAVLQMASSLEVLAVEVYDVIIGAGLLMDTAELFRAHHEEHARLFQSVIEDAGADPVLEADPDVTQELQPMIDALVDEASALTLASEVEQILETTYQGSVGAYDDASLNQVAMTVGGSEARHGAVLAQRLGQAAAPDAFQE